MPYSIFSFQFPETNMVGQYFFCLNNETNLFSADFIWNNMSNVYCVIAFIILSGEQ